jgi:hypothetical protein
MHTLTLLTLTLPSLTSLIRTVRKASAAQLLKEMEARSTLQHLPHISIDPWRLQPYLKRKFLCADGTALKMRCRLGTLQVNHLLHKRNLSSSPACPLCPASEEDINHFVLDCPAYAMHRDDLFDSLRPLLPTPVDFDTLFGPDTRRTARVANILSDRVWSKSSFCDANKAVCTFLSQCWNTRTALVSVPP